MKKTGILLVLLAAVAAAYAQIGLDGRDWTARRAQPRPR